MQRLREGMDKEKSKAEKAKEETEITEMAAGVHIFGLMEISNHIF